MAGIDGVQRAENEMAGFRGHECDFHGRAITHFADEDDLWCLAKRGTQAIWIIIEVVPEFALIEGGPTSRVDELDRVLQGHDVDRLFLVNLVQDRGQCRRLATASGAGHKHESGFFSGDFLKNRWQSKSAECRNNRLQFPHDNGELSLLPKNVDSESGLIVERVTAIAGTVEQKFLHQAPVSLHERELLGLVGGQPPD